MCLAVPYTIKQIFPDGSALAVSNGVEAQVRLDLIEAPAPEDTVLVHAGFAIQKLDRGESEELIALWDEIKRAEKAEEALIKRTGGSGEPVKAAQRRGEPCPPEL